MNSVAKRLLLGAALPVFVVMGVGSVSAQTGGTSTSASAEVTIYRDKMGVPHVYADTAPAVFFGGSYAIAQDRLSQAELESRAILGRMAEIAGPGAVEADKAARIALPTDSDMQAQFDRLAPEYQAIMRGMYDGWTARVREVKADPKQLPYEFREWGIQPTEWSMLDFLKVMGSVTKYYGTGGGGRENSVSMRRLITRPRRIFLPNSKKLVLTASTSISITSAVTCRMQCYRRLTTALAS